MLLKIAVGAACLYLAVALAAFVFQRKLMYRPEPARVSPAAAGLRGVEEAELRTPDGETLIAWGAPARPGQPTLLYFHGNGGSLVDRRERIQRFQAAGLGVFMLSYRGYSGSTGAPSEAANVADAKLAFDTLAARGVAPADIVLYGESLGSGVAVQVAAERNAKAVILDGPFLSMLAAARYHYPALPVRPFLRDDYRSDLHIPRVSAPLLILHGARDAILPLDQAKELHALANEPKRLHVFPNGGHVDLYDHGAMTVVMEFLKTLR
ncbi:MAG: alpha/beta fold hydrolase [Hyphomicrobiales bacterium]|nr:alpha/beta fold hydrolase [Hyphomicrobiales bacterium]